MAVSPDGKTLAVGSSHNDGNIQFWDLATGTLRKALHGSSGSIKGMVFSHDGNSLATAWFDSTVRDYSPVTGELCAPEVFHTQRFLTMVYSPDDRLLIAECPDGVIQIRNPTAERLPSVLEGHIDRDIDNIDFPCPTAFSHDCCLLAYVSDLDTTTGKSIYTCPDTVCGESLFSQRRYSGLGLSRGLFENLEYVRWEITCSPLRSRYDYICNFFIRRRVFGCCNSAEHCLDLGFIVRKTIQLRRVSKLGRHYGIFTKWSLAHQNRRWCDPTLGSDG